MQEENLITIRPLSNTDATTAQQLVLGIQRDEFGVKIAIDDQPDLQDLSHFGSSGKFWGAFAGKELVGTISIVMFSTDSAAIRKMFVKKPFRGAEYNIARLLLEELTSFARQKGIAWLYLGTIELLHAAVRFYNKNGFMQEDKDMLPKGFPLMDSDNVFFKKAI